MNYDYLSRLLSRLKQETTELLTFKKALDSPPQVLAILRILSISAIFFLGLAIVLFVGTFLEGAYWRRTLCLTNTCANAFFVDYAAPLAILKAALDFIVAFATSAGIVVALLSYLTSVRVAAFSNHVSHLNLFQQYVTSEIQKRDRLAPSSFDLLLLYNKIFHTSNKGLTDVAKAYILFIEQVNDLIEYSNNQILHGKSGDYRYKQHQERMRDHMRNAGITLHLAPRNDFYELEGQLLSLFDTVNQSMCHPQTIPKTVARRYI